MNNITIHRNNPKVSLHRGSHYVAVDGEDWAWAKMEHHGSQGVEYVIYQLPQQGGPLKYSAKTSDGRDVKYTASVWKKDEIVPMVKKLIEQGILRHPSIRKAELDKAVAEREALMQKNRDIGTMRYLALCLKRYVSLQDQQLTYQQFLRKVAKRINDDLVRPETGMLEWPKNSLDL